MDPFFSSLFLLSNKYLKKNQLKFANFCMYGFTDFSFDILHLKSFIVGILQTKVTTECVTNYTKLCDSLDEIAEKTKAQAQNLISLGRFPPFQRNSREKSQF